MTVSRRALFGLTAGAAAAPLLPARAPRLLALDVDMAKGPDSTAWATFNSEMIDFEHYSEAIYHIRADHFGVMQVRAVA